MVFKLSNLNLDFALSQVDKLFNEHYGIIILRKYDSKYMKIGDLIIGILVDSNRKGTLFYDSNKHF